MEQILTNAPWQMWATFLVILVTIVFYALDKVLLEIVSAGALIALLLIFHLAPLEVDGEAIDLTVLLAGFASPALFAILGCLLYTSPSPRDLSTSRMPSSA